MVRPLEGLKVLDLSRLLPGPLASLVLADLGADILKVEDPGGGDYLRWMPPLLREQGAMFHALNRGKRSIALDLKAPEGASILRRLVQSGWDVVLESFRPGVLDRLGVGYDALREANPGVILCSISGYGQDGPLAHRAGHDLNYVALAGVLGTNGTAGGPPVPPGVQVADVGGGALPASVGLLAAVIRRQRTGEGAWVDVSMTEGALMFLGPHLAASQATGTPAGRGTGPLNGGYPCYGVYRTADDRFMSLAALEPHFWQRFCRAVGREDLVTEGWSGGEAGQRATAEVAAIFQERSQAEWVARLESVDCCCEPVLEGDEVNDSPLFAERGAFVTVEDPTDGPLTQVATPIRLRGEEGTAPRPAPGLGADTTQVLADAGFSPEEVEALRAAGVVAQG